MRIAIITTSYPAQAESFAGHFVAAEAQELTQAGHQVVVCAPGFRGQLTLEGVPVSGMGGARLFRSPGALPRLHQQPYLVVEALTFVRRARLWLAANGPFDLIQAHWLIPSAWPVSKDAKAPVQIVCHGSDVELLRRFPGFLARGILRQLARPNIQFRVVSENLKRKLLALAPDLEHRVFVKPAALQLPPTPERAIARQAVGVHVATKLIVIIARLIKGKRVDIALQELLPIVEGSASAPQVVVIGDGPERETLEHRYPFARFLGELPREHALLWLASADLLLSASQLEGAPTAVREARALAVPVVSAIAGDIEQWALSDRGIHLFASPAELQMAVTRALSTATC